MSSLYMCFYYTNVRMDSRYEIWVKMMLVRENVDLLFSYFSFVGYYTSQR